MVLNGNDSAFYKFETLKKFMDFHLGNNNDMSLLTCEVSDPALLGRVARDGAGKLAAVVEKENVTPEMKDIHEVSTGTYCFRRNWFEKMFSGIKPIPGLNEYGLPSFIDLAAENEARYNAMKLENPDEWFGINTPEQLEEANRRKYK
jgi:bifunctional UDP-N-acetylglucosamine pyrophosphorylase/glucosamine-1-phosphate N-acetyltransferase